jgi:hypothetical protein
MMMLKFLPSTWSTILQGTLSPFLKVYQDAHLHIDDEFSREGEFFKVFP